MSYESFYGLVREPFSITPDPQFVYMSEKHREALAYLMYGLRRGGGFVLLTGDIGAGKTTIWRCFLEQLPGNVDVAYVVNPKLGVAALLARVCEDLHVEPPPDGAAIDPIDAIHGHLLLAHARGRRTLIVVDEAQALSSDVLEQMRLLTNLDSGDRKLVQMLLIGQPELRALLETPALEPVAQRVVARFHLPALAEPDTHRYVAHRLRVAGLQGELPFDADAIGEIHRLCGGVPRRINVLCDRALFAGHAEASRRITRAIVQRAAAEVFGTRTRPPTPSDALSPRRRRDRESLLRQLMIAGVAVTALAAGLMLAPAVRLIWAASVASANRLERRAAEAVDPVAAAAPAVATRPSSAPVAVATPQSATPAPTAAPAPMVARAETNTAPGIGTPLSANAGAAGTPGAAPVAPADAASAAANLDALFGAGSADEAPAWRALAGLWGTTLGPGDGCAAALRQALLCFRMRGGLAPIRQLARPGIVALTDARGRVAHVLLTALGDDRATLRRGDAELTVPLAHLARVWRGDFATLWRAPPGYAEGDVVVSAGPLAPWLAQQLAKIDGTAVTPLDEAALQRRVFAFQLAQGLAPDGLAGPLTLMQLNRASGVDEPRLAGGRP